MAVWLVNTVIQKEMGACIQQDDMQEIYPLLQEAEMVVFGVPSVLSWI